MKRLLALLSIISITIAHAQQYGETTLYGSNVYVLGELILSDSSTPVSQRIPTNTVLQVQGVNVLPQQNLTFGQAITFTNDITFMGDNEIKGSTTLIDSTLNYVSIVTPSTTNLQVEMRNGRDLYIDTGSGECVINGNIDLTGNNITNVGTLNTSTANVSVIKSSTASPLIVSSNMTVYGDLTIIGELYQNPSRAFAYLTAPSNTIVSGAFAWTNVAGVFSNVVLDGFGTTTVNGQPAIIYTNGYTGRMDVTLIGEVAASSPNQVVYLSTSINGVANTNQGIRSSVKCISSGVAYPIANIGVPAVSNGTTIQIITTCDSAATLTFSQMKARMDIWE